MNSLLGTALDDRQASNMNMPRSQGSGSLLGACPQPVFDDHHHQYNHMQPHQAPQYAQALPSLLNDVDWNSGFNQSFGPRGNSLLGSLHYNDYRAIQHSRLHPQAAPFAKPVASSSILGSVGGMVQDPAPDRIDGPLMQQRVSYPGSSVASLLGPVRTVPAQHQFPYAAQAPQTSGQNHGAVSGPPGRLSLLGSVGGVGEEAFLREHHMPVPEVGGPQFHGYAGVGGSILGSAEVDAMEGRSFRQQGGYQQPARSCSGQQTSTIPSLLGSVSSGHQGNRISVVQSQRGGGQGNPIPLITDLREARPVDPMVNSGLINSSHCSVVIENLPVNISPDDLKTTIYGYCMSAPPLDVQATWPGVARLIFADPQLAVTAVRQLDGLNLSGHILRVFVESYELQQDRMKSSIRSFLST